MCQNCDVDGAILLAGEILAALPSWKTEKIAKVEDMREWIVSNRHVTDRMISALEAIGGGEHEMRKRRPAGAPSAEAGEALDVKSILTPHVLLTPPKNAPLAILERTVSALVRQALSFGGALRVMNANALNWKALRRGARDGAYAWLAKNFDACAVVENSVGMLGRGAFDIAVAFKDAGKPVGVARKLSQGFHMVGCGVEKTGSADWKFRWAKCVTLDDESLSARLPSKCSVCSLDQYDTLSGVTCQNGHGGADASSNERPGALDLESDEGGW